MNADKPPRLDWSKHLFASLAACSICGKKAFMRDERGRPCHKTCAEAQAHAQGIKGGSQ